MSVRVRVRRLPHGCGLELPAYTTGGAAGADLHAAVREPMTLNPGERAAVPTGLILEIPPGYEGQVRPRSGLAVRHGVTLVNAPGTVDSDYRGEVRVLLINLGREPFIIARGDRIAQLIVVPVMQADFTEAAELSGTDRGAGGFGSTGV